MGRPRQFALVLLCATATLASWSAARLGGFDWSDIEHTAASIWNRAAAPGATTPLPLAMAAATTLHLKLPAPAVAHAAAPAADAAALECVRDGALVFDRGVIAGAGEFIRQDGANAG